MRSDFMKKGVERIPHRALFYALGLTDEEIERPIIGVVNAQNEIILSASGKAALSSHHFFGAQYPDPAVRLCRRNVSGTNQSCP